jgi:hypothetical protein
MGRRSVDGPSTTLAAVRLLHLSSLAEGFEEHPIDYIKSFRLLDRDGRTWLRGSDHNSFLLFDLPAAERSALLEAYRAKGVPEAAIEQVDVNVDTLEP